MVENKIAADLRALTGARQSEARSGVYIVAVLAGLLILITLGLVHTIFEHRRADVALHESEEKFRNLFEYANDGIFIIDPASRRFLDANAIALERLGYTREELLELSVNALDTDDDDGAGEEFVRQITKAGGLVFERTHLHKDGSELPSEVSARVVEYGDRTVIQSFVRDITERKQAEEQLRRAQRMEAIGQLTGGVAHDFNNLLAIILGNAELLNERLGGDALAESVIRAADRGGELTQRLLAFSRRQPLQPKITDLSTLVVDMEELLLRTLGETIKIETVNAVGLWTTEADPGQIENALLNFANNARDAMPKGGTLTIEAGNVTLDDDSAARVGTVPGDYVVLAVADTGTGMSPEVLKYVFEPFFSTKDVGEGSGLGLSMAYGFAKQSGGSLQIESELDGGTIVRMYLPRANGPIAATEENARFPEERYEGNGNILVVEDDPDVRSLVVQILGDLGYQTTEAESGAAALTLLEDGRKFDLLFTDVVMPGGISGPELFRKTRTRFPDLKVIFTSGYNDETIGNSAQVKVQAPLVRKPYRKSDLGRVVREVLSNTG
jgi:PAS domain S-box-containing protein